MSLNLIIRPKNGFNNPSKFTIFNYTSEQLKSHLENGIKNYLINTKNLPKISDKIFINCPLISNGKDNFLLEISYPENEIIDEIGYILNDFLFKKIWELNNNEYCVIETPWPQRFFDDKKIIYENWISNLKAKGE